ncbi:ATP-grasp domain-containing protein [Micromonospora sp. FIMYZ51]|uniref:ATP-grasp domain-containing protein n=1 Tax=Micromonospora sp. FIMYZ51 TaxID=3051832 RepID=UPI00311D4182
MNADVILVGYGRTWLDHIERLWPGARVLLVVEPAVVRDRRVRQHLAESWPGHELYELEYRRPLAADLFHLWHPELTARAILPTDDTGVPFAARLAERLGLPGSGGVPAVILSDKWRLRQLADVAGVSSPAWQVVRDVAEATAFAERAGGEIVLKPAARAGSSGVELVAEPAGLPAAWQRMFRSDAETYLAEQRVIGEQYSTNLLLDRGEVRFANVTGAHVTPGRHPVPVTHFVDPGLAPQLHDTLVDAGRRLTVAAGFGTGFVHIEWIVRDGTPWLIEAAGRFPGGLMMLLIGYAHEVDTMADYLAVMSGGPVPAVPPRPARHATVALSVPASPGRVSAVHGTAQAAALPGVLAVELAVGAGDEVGELVSIPRIPGRVAAIGATLDEATRTARSALATVRIVTGG